MLGLLQTLVIYGLPLLFVLTLVVTVHELGHFLTAKACGVKIEAFSIGFGKALAKWRDKSGVEWRIGWAPLGGYVKFAGDENVASVPDQDDLVTLRQHIIATEGPAAVHNYYHFKPVWQRALIAVAGPSANFLFAILLFALLFMTVGKIIDPQRVTAVTPGSVAERAGFKAGDLIVKTDGQTFESWGEMGIYIQQRAGLPIRFDINRAGAPVQLVATPAAVEINDPVMGRHQEGRIGLEHQMVRGEARRVPVSPLAAIPMGAAQTWDILHTTTFYLGRLITGQVPADQIGGIVRITKVSGEMAKSGAEGAPNVGAAAVGVGLSMLGLCAFLSVSIGFMNLLPVPVLDGGHLVFYAYEAVARRPLNAKVQAVSYRAGLALVVSFMLFAAWNDLLRYDVFKTLSGLFS
jgi:regulator of sigma E protease